MPSVEGSVLLDCVVGEVYFPFEVEDVELVGGSADVALLVPIGLEHPVELAYHHVVPDVELALTVEEGPVDVELHNERFLCPVVVLPLALHYRVQLVYLVDHRNAVPSVSQLAWLHDPNVSHGPGNAHPVLGVLLLLVDD